MNVCALREQLEEYPDCAEVMIGGDPIEIIDYDPENCYVKIDNGHTLGVLHKDIIGIITNLGSIICELAILAVVIYFLAKLNI